MKCAYAFYLVKLLGEVVPEECSENFFLTDYTKREYYASGGGCIPQINNPVGKEMMNNECAGVFNLVSYLRTVHGGSK